ncbi:unnamed protein product, partial [Leptidea sinapis]
SSLTREGNESRNKDRQEKGESISSDFGHVFRDRVRNTPHTYGLPIDEELKKYSFTQKDASQITEIAKERPSFLSAREEMIYNQKKTHGDTFLGEQFGSSNGTRPQMYYDFEKILESNFVRPNRRQLKKLQNIDGNTKEIVGSKQKNINWTTCDQFAKKALFHPNDIVNLDWLPFYLWSDRDLGMARIHRFTYPTKKVVQHYQTEYGPYTRNIDWKQPKILLSEEIEKLLIAGDRKGLFYAITHQEVPDSIKQSNSSYPVIKLRLKIVDPYLALMYCNEPYAVLMSIADTGPKIESEMEKEAAVLNFNGEGHPVFRDIDHENYLTQVQREQRMKLESRKYLSVQRTPVDLSTLA